MLQFQIYLGVSICENMISSQQLYCIIWRRKFFFPPPSLNVCVTYKTCSQSMCHDTQNYVFIPSELSRSASKLGVTVDWHMWEGAYEANTTRFTSCERIKEVDMQLHSILTSAFHGSDCSSTHGGSFSSGKKKVHADPWNRLHPEGYKTNML